MPSAQARAVNTIFRYWGKPLLRDASVTSLRRVTQRLERLAGPPPRGTHITAFSIGAFAGEWISTPNSRAGRVVLYLPGGGFVARAPAVSRLLVARICREAQADALLAFYRLAPEHRFPAGVEDCVAAYEHLLERGTAPSEIVIGGDSAGGCLTLAALMALRDRAIPLPAAAFTLSAVADLRDHRNGSRTTNEARDSLLSLDGSEAWHRHYLGDPSLVNEPLVSPLLGDFTGLPPLLVQASTAEILLDDSRLVVERAAAAGVECSLELFADLPHDWHLIARLPESRQALRSVGAFVRDHTTRTSSSTPPTRTGGYA